MRIPVHTRYPQPNVEPRRGEPLTFGVPLPRGLVHATTSWTCLSTDVGPTAVQVRALDRWADGSLRWALVDAQVDIATGEGQFYVDISDAANSGDPTPRAIDVHTDGNRVTVDTGAARF